MLTLYHHRGAVCAQKVRLALAEKNLGWTSIEVDFADRAFMDAYRRELNAAGVVPTLLVDRQPLVESNVILEWLEESFPAVRLSPDNAIVRARMRVWLSQIDIDIHTAINALSFALVFRTRFLAMPAEQREEIYRTIPNAERRWRRRELVEKGLQSPLVRFAVSRFMQLFEDMERALHASRFLVGEDFTLADLALVPYFERLLALGFETEMRGYPRLAAWWDAASGRESYARAILDWGGAQARSDMESVTRSAREEIGALWRGPAES